jgi:eukaryotic-like serine/threonine-protein kinase
MPSDLAAEPTASRVWDAVADRLEAFARAWETGPPALHDFVPADPRVIRQLTLVELIKYDLEQRLQRGLPRLLEAYFVDFPELVGNGPPCDLLYEDFHLRKRAGETVRPSDYYQRFPERAVELERLLGGTASTRSTAMFSNRAPVTPKPGDRLDEFDLLALLGEGQFAKVFLARQTSMQRLVALKVSAHRGSEAQTLAQLDHPHIVRVYDQRVLPDREYQLVYMPYLPGGTLGEVLNHVRSVPSAKRSGRTLLEAVDISLVRRAEVPPAASPTRAVWAGRSWPASVAAIGAKLAVALDYAHRRGVLHRDVKPANILLTADGEPLLADFNIGCCSKVEGAGPTAFFGGTLPYMAPEHIDAFNPDHERPPESLDGRADIYGLAVTLWELHTGKNPFGIEYLRGSWPETLGALAAHRRAGPPAEAVAELQEADTPGLKSVLLNCLAPDPAGRPAAAGEMARELELCLKPATRALVRPKPGGWRAMVREYPVLAIFALTLVPNLFASAFNILYNFEEIIKKWPVDPQLFKSVIQTVNGVFFPFGLFLLGCAIWPVRRALRRIRAGGAIDPADLEPRRRRALRLGQIAAALCVLCWLLAGCVWPVILTFKVGPPQPGTGLYLHFMASFVICGLIAATYPYFLVTYLSVRTIYPALFGSGGPGPGDDAALRRAERALGVYRVMAAAIPLAAVGLLVWHGVTDDNKFAVAVLVVTGVAGSLMVYILEGRIRADLEALAQVPGAS